MRADEHAACGHLAQHRVELTAVASAFNRVVPDQHAMHPQELPQDIAVEIVVIDRGLDRHASAADAMLTSLQVVARNPVPMAAWGLIVAVLLVIGSLPFFLGLAIVIPLLGHATWHLYRRVIAPDLNPQPLPPRWVRERRSAADFPAALFPWRRKDDA